MCRDRSAQIVADAWGRPRFIGPATASFFVASYIPALLEHNTVDFFLADGDIAVSPKRLLRDGALRRQVDRPAQHVHGPWVPSWRKRGVQSFRANEIFEQPLAVRDTLSAASLRTPEIFLDDMKLPSKHSASASKCVHRLLRHQLAPGLPSPKKIHYRAPWGPPPAESIGLGNRFPIAIPSSTLIPFTCLHHPVRETRMTLVRSSRRQSHRLAYSVDLQRQGSHGHLAEASVDHPHITPAPKYRVASRSLHRAAYGPFFLRLLCRTPLQSAIKLTSEAGQALFQLFTSHSTQNLNGFANRRRPSVTNARAPFFRTPIFSTSAGAFTTQVALVGRPQAQRISYPAEAIPPEKLNPPVRSQRPPRLMLPVVVSPTHGPNDPGLGTRYEKAPNIPEYRPRRHRLSVVTAVDRLGR